MEIARLPDLIEIELMCVVYYIVAHHLPLRIRTTGACSLFTLDGCEGKGLVDKDLELRSFTRPTVI